MAWIRPLRRLHRALDRSLRLIDSTDRAVAVSEEQSAARPIRTSRKLDRAAAWLSAASAQLAIAARSLGETVDRAAAAPQYAGPVPELLATATSCWITAAARLAEASNQLYGLHSGLLDDLQSGRLVPERIEPPADRGPRIILRTPPLLIAARAFLLHRRSSVRDRIASVPVRRRRQALIVVTNAPRQISRGRAPPSPDC